ncbi:MAG: hypothetical protein KKH88_04910 [Nanoarchaeota archaeon]|nr:hypothetical protein [Nanoarchaeota archaeon]
MNYYRIIYPISLLFFWVGFITFLSTDIGFFGWLAGIGGLVAFIIYIIVSSKLKEGGWWFIFIGFVGLVIHWAIYAKKIAKLDKGIIEKESNKNSRVNKKKGTNAKK